MSLLSAEGSNRACPVQAFRQNKQVGGLFGGFLGSLPLSPTRSKADSWAKLLRVLGSRVRKYSKIWTDSSSLLPPPPHPPPGPRLAELGEQDLFYL